MMSQDNPVGGVRADAVPFGVRPTAPTPAPPAMLGEQPAPAGVALVKDTTTAAFAADVIQESRRQPVLVDFWAPWCGPCKQLTPVLEKVVHENGGSVRLVKMNIDEHPAIAGQLGIQSIPAVIAFKDGRPVDGFMGAVPESQIREFIQRVGGGAPGGDGISEALSSAGEAGAQGDWAMAGQIYAAVLQQSPDNVDALAGLAGALFETGDTARAKQVLDEVPQEKRESPALAGLLAKIALAEQTASLGEPSELRRRVGADPSDHQARFDLAMIQNARGERSAAADNLLWIIKADRGWKEDGARAQLLQFFEAWGMTDEATLAARRKLSSLLFS
jgi:putative thioredoxin